MLTLPSILVGGNRVIKKFNQDDIRKTKVYHDWVGT